MITINNAPVAVNDSYSVNEGGTLNIAGRRASSATTRIADIDTLTAVLVTGPTHASSFTLNPDGSFTYVARRQRLRHRQLHLQGERRPRRLANIATVTITVTSVNDAPSFTKGADVTVLEDSGLHTATGWATAISAGGPEESRADADVRRHATTTTALFAARSRRWTRRPGR